MVNKSRKQYYREMIIDMVPLDDSLEANGASKDVIDKYRAFLLALQDDYERQYGEVAWWGDGQE
jgi:hypothetical protein